MNLLANETSPYLLQHANNPVYWMPWNEETLQKAKKENKLLLISIGYAACHWCHVMEHECFEDHEVANTMNPNFINIKVDREERPDVDQLYMDALQIMTGSGGWPLNIVALPDGRPFWGGTYLKKEQWISTLNQISELYKKENSKIIEYAQNLEKSIENLYKGIINTDTLPFTLKELSKAVATWSPYFDIVNGGPTRAPKFMMPVNFSFLLRYSNVANDVSLFNYVDTTLKKMAYGGVFDQIDGGFSRYSVDKKWHVPHFEKMLYDNAQLVSLYTKAYQHTKNELFKDIADRTILFVENELMDNNNAFYSSLDADSLDEYGVLKEGAFYVWKETELKEILKNDFPLFKDYFNINEYGYWEEDNYVLIRKETKQEIAQKHKITKTVTKERINKAIETLSKHRKKRNFPRLDDKILTSWNALMLEAYIDAHKAFKNDTYLRRAIQNATFLKSYLLKNDGSLYRNHKKGESTINGYLEDYATLAHAFITLYEVTSNEEWLTSAKKLVDYCICHFYSEETGLFYFTSDEETLLITRTIEKNDNVIPASNSIIGKALFKLSKLYTIDSYSSIVSKMLNTMKEHIIEYPYSHANWLDLSLNYTTDFYEIVIIGKEAKEKAKELNSLYLPNALICFSLEASTLPLFKNRYKKNETLIYVCKNNTCDLSVKTIEKAVSLIN